LLAKATEQIAQVRRKDRAALEAENLDSAATLRDSERHLLPASTGWIASPSGRARTSLAIHGIRCSESDGKQPKLWERAG